MKVNYETSYSKKKYLLISIFLIIAIGCIVYNLKTVYTALSGYVFVTKWNYEFSELDVVESRIKSIAIDSYGYVYLTCGSFIQKFDSDGNLLKQWGEEGNRDKEDDLPGQFDWIGDICIDSSNHIYVLDSNNNRIQQFTSRGDFLNMWKLSGTKLSSFCKIEADITGNIYVMDEHGQVRKFDSKGNFINSWDYANVLSDIKLDSKGNVCIASYVITGEFSKGEEKRNYHTRICYITNFNPSGKFLNQWKPYKEREDGETSGIALDSNDNIFIVENCKNQIQVFDSTGKFITRWGSEGSGDGQFKDPEDIAIDREDNVYVVDSGNNRIQKFRPFHNK